MNLLRKTSSHLLIVIFIIQLICVIGSKRTNLPDKILEINNFDDKIGNFEKVLSNLKLEHGAYVNFEILQKEESNKENLEVLKTVFYSYEACLHILHILDKTVTAESKDACEDKDIITRVDGILKALGFEYVEGEEKKKKVL
ncbi:unnamed protein product [Meloidogyne enterolobii]|uniref:Uncharacterized protein n=1 Tax=Meloidogyne enterolobii TaxID=390850 RepID=A0ACB0Y519_MELEN